MKLQNTLKISFILLIIISLNVYSAEDQVAACSSALDKGDAISAQRFAEEALKRNSKNREALLCDGRALNAQGRYTEALSAFERGEKLSKSAFDDLIAHLLIGNLHMKNGKYPEALASYEKSLSLSTTEKNDKFIRISENMLGETYALSGDYPQALAHYATGSKLAMNDNERADSYERLASTYKALAQYDQAIEFQLKGVMMQKIAGDLDQYANASLALGQIYIAAKDYASAERTLNKLLQFCKDNGGAYYEAKTDLYLAQSKAESGNADAAKTLLSDAGAIAKNIHASDLVAEIDAASNKLKN